MPHCQRCSWPGVEAAFCGVLWRGQGPGWELLAQAPSLVRAQTAQGISNHFADGRRWGQQREKENDAGIAVGGGRGAVLLHKGAGRKKEEIEKSQERWGEDLWGHKIRTGMRQFGQLERVKLGLWGWEKRRGEKRGERGTGKAPEVEERLRPQVPILCQGWNVNSEVFWMPLLLSSWWPYSCETCALSPPRTGALVSQATGSGSPSAHEAKGWVVGHFPALLPSGWYPAMDLLL